MIDDAPAIPKRVRTIAYLVLLGVSALVLLATGLAPIWLEAGFADQVVRTAGVVTGVAGLIGGGLGVTYRPTRYIGEHRTVEGHHVYTGPDRIDV